MFKKYLLNTSGNFSIMFAVVSTMLILGVGAAIDLSGLTSQKTTLQSMSDAAVLAAVSSGEEDYDTLKQIAALSLEANNVDGLDLEWDLKIEGNNVSIVLKAPYDTKLMGFAGKDVLPVNALSEATLPEETPINIALVLDTTDSMEGANMTALKAASSVLVDIFKEYDDDTRVAVVPFSNYVNVGLSRRNETWIDVPADTVEYIPAGQCYMKQDTTCTNYEQRTGTETVDGVTRPTSWNQCTNRVDDGPEYEYCPPAQTKEIKWSGCIGSRDGTYNQTASYRGKRIPGILGDTCGEEILPLTDDMDAVKARINSLNASKLTYLPVGLVNGWRMLEADKPFDDFSNQDAKRKRALILMTDGANTLSIQDPYQTGKHDGSDADEANELTATLCNNIKNENIDVWSVAYNFDGADSKDMLRGCATSSDQFFDASNQAELIKAFENIGKSLFDVRLTR